MSVNVSVRLDDSLAERLRLRVRAAGETLSDRLRRYADEGLRRDEDPLITFRDGPAGRRAELGLAGRSDADVFAAAADGGDALLTQNVSDLARLSGEHVAAGRYHSGVLIALSSRFSRRPAGYSAIAAAVAAVAGDRLDDRLVYL